MHMSARAVDIYTESSKYNGIVPAPSIEPGVCITPSSNVSWLATLGVWLTFVYGISLCDVSVEVEG